MLNQANYVQEKIWNAWLLHGQAHDTGYRGINLTVKHWQGYLFEIQFHTPDSWRVKSETHPLYKESRLKNVSVKRKQEVRQLTKAVSSNLRMPPNIDSIK
jgi:hypothetical protein